MPCPRPMTHSQGLRHAKLQWPYQMISQNTQQVQIGCSVCLDVVIYLSTLRLGPPRPHLLRSPKRTVEFPRFDVLC